MDHLIDEHGQPISIAEALQRRDMARIADLRALLFCLADDDLIDLSVWTVIRARCLADVDQEYAKRRDRFLARQKTMPSPHVDAADAAEERALRSKAEEILRTVKEGRGGWRQVVSEPVALAIETWGAEVSRHAYARGLSAMGAGNEEPSL